MRSLVALNSLLHTIYTIKKDKHGKKKGGAACAAWLAGQVVWQTLLAAPCGKCNAPESAASEYQLILPFIDLWCKWGALDNHIHTRAQKHTARQKHVPLCQAILSSFSAHVGPR